MEKNLEEEIRKSSRTKTPISFIMIDIDNLQKCNYTYGHFVGDQVIKEVAEQIKELISEEDVASRYGGEKMAVFFPGKSMDEAAEVAEQIRSAIESLEILVPIGDNLKVTVSIGISSFPEYSDTIEIIRSADEAMYQAKREGKNRVVISGVQV